MAFINKMLYFCTMHLQKTYTVDEAQKRLERYCAYQERCHQEVTQKLYEMRMIPEARDQIIVNLLQNNFLNEERFAKAFVRGKFRIKKWGKQRLQIELKRRAINKTIIAIALKEIDNDAYYDTFNALAEKKFESLTETNLQKKRKKLVDYLAYRGWESQMIYDKIRELIP